jgi:hypothetical protein
MLGGFERYSARQLSALQRVAKRDSSRQSAGKISSELGTRDPEAGTRVYGLDVMSVCSVTCPVSRISCEDAPTDTL